MSYIIKAVLSHAAHPKYGQITVPFPIPDQEYVHTLEMMGPLGIGDTLKKDCHVDQLISDYVVLHRMEGSSVTVDELDFLAKRLDSFDVGEAEQFQAMAERLKLSDIADFINLTFCCQQVTVIKDFSDLETAGRAHYMNLNGGCAGSEELANLDGCETALLLIDTVNPAVCGAQKIISSYRMEIREALCDIFACCPAVAARIFFDADQEQVSVEYNPLWLELHQQQEPVQDGMQQMM